MTWLHKLPNSHPSPPGLEWALLRRMPRILVLGTLVPALAAGLARFLPPGVADLYLVDIYALGTVILHWTLVLTLTIGCIIVWVMKGPAYVADAYPLQDSERPG